MTTTTAVQSPWAIVDQIIRQEIPDAVPGCDRLRGIAPITDEITALQNLRLIHSVTESRDAHLAWQLLGILGDAGSMKGSPDYMEFLANKIRKTLAEIKGAN